jgi:hypothetical protein
MLRTTQQLDGGGLSPPNYKVQLQPKVAQLLRKQKM